MLESCTAGAQRALDRAQARARRRGARVVEPIDLLAALVDEAESRAAELLAEFGLQAERLWALLETAELILSPEDFRAENLPPSDAFRSALTGAALSARAFDRGRQVGTEHLLSGVLTAPGAASELLAAAGIDPEALTAKLAGNAAVEAEPLPLAGEVPRLDLGDPTEELDLARILDASANRAREGLRVIEDYARFVLDDPGLTRRLKEVRHRFAAALAALDPEMFIAARDTQGDVGTRIMTASEQSRENPRAVLSANFKRTAEALRSLEEYAKLTDVWAAGQFEVLRYDVYTLEKLTLTAARSASVLGDARLMLLVCGLPTLGDLTWIVGEALAGGVDVIQLREKAAPDRAWLRRAREVRILTAQAKARFLVNDRPDLARLAGADGVHLGQDDLSVRDARRIVGPAALIGVSTHDRAQLDRAMLDGAGYLGVGPVFPSETKSFDDFAGLSLVRHAAETTTLPWFAIGGINAESLEEVLEAGARRIAVSAAILRAEYPRKAAETLRARLDAVWDND